METVITLTEPLRHVAAVVTRHGTPEHADLLARAVNTLLNHAHKRPGQPVPDRNRLPALLLIQTIGTTCIAFDRLELLGAVCRQVVWHHDHGDRLGVGELLRGRASGQNNMQQMFKHRGLPGAGRHYLQPASEWMQPAIAGSLERVRVTGPDCERAYGDAELVLDLIAIGQSDEYGDDVETVWGQGGRYAYLYDGHDENGRTPTSRIASAIDRHPQTWGALAAAGHDGNAEDLKVILEKLTEGIRRHGASRY